MFGWLAKLLISGPIQGSGCACCEGKKKRLEKMQQAIAEGEIPASFQPESRKLSFSSGSFSARLNADGSGDVEYYAKNTVEEVCDCGGQGCSCGGDCGDDDVCHCGRGDDCCKKTGKKHEGCCCGKH